MGYCHRCVRWERQADDDEQGTCLFLLGILEQMGFSTNQRDAVTKWAITKAKDGCTCEWRSLRDTSECVNDGR